MKEMAVLVFFSQFHLSLFCQSELTNINVKISNILKEEEKFENGPGSNITNSMNDITFKR